MELITITTAKVGDGTVQTVNARDLHAFLEVGKDFSTWIKDRIDQYDFVDGRDFCSFLSETGFPQNGGKPLGGRPAKEYALTLDMAKELAMVERNEKGKQARAYFIECERRAKTAQNIEIKLNDPAFLRDMLSNYAEKVISLEGRIEEMRPQVQALERIALSEGSMCITDAAKSLQIRPRDLFAYLRAKGWIYTRAGSASEVAYQSKLQAGYLEHKCTTVNRSDGSERTVTQVRVTAKGLAKLAEEYGKQPLA